ncbi:MAG: sugar phosphate nucleotidyltransferase [Clostridia bacterium]|nr:sugar phosphate nucleotidyltransferase [Clostridia bacterium]
MKCLILAGGRGERLWPLSRKNYPKQFIQIQRNHSIFQETVARNIPYCDEFIIVTGYEYRYIIKSQMAAFQGITYRCIFEESPRKTTAAILLACMDLQPSELVFAVASNHLLDTDTEFDSVDDYKNAVLQGKNYASSGNIATFGIKMKNVNSHMGFMQFHDDSIVKFVEKPRQREFEWICNNPEFLRNSGMYIFENGLFQNELKKYAPELYEQCVLAHNNRRLEDGYTLYLKDVLNGIAPISIEKSLFEKSAVLKVVKPCFRWKNIRSLEDIHLTEYLAQGISVLNNCEKTTVINNCKRQVVVVSDIDNAMVVNTADAIYIGKYGESRKIKEILKAHSELKPFSDRGTIFYRSWGYYEQLIEESAFRVRRVTIFPGKTIYLHRHKLRSENWTVVEGEALVVVDGKTSVLGIKSNIEIPEDAEHQISNIGEVNATFIETAVGEIVCERDKVSEKSENIDAYHLGIYSEPFVKLRPAFKDYLWGGKRLRDVYNKKCDYDTIAESWELSAHHAGQSIVETGRYKGLNFEEYLRTVGSHALGWKCQTGINFPLLVKFIDAKDNLSVQVHPDDDYALEHEHEYGKNEMWYIIDCEPGSILYVGFKQDVSREEVEERIRRGTVLEILNQIETKPGDVFFIPAGTVHAIGAGNLICEIQQNSNSTYRLYDYNRKDKYGNLRELNLEKALDVLNYNKYVPQKFEKVETDNGKLLCRCKYFESIIYDISGEMKLSTEDSRFASIVCLDGSGTIASADAEETVAAGDSIFVQAGKQLQLKGKMKIIVSQI